MTANALIRRLVDGIDRLAPRLRARPADHAIDLDDLYRLEAHWALTFARLGSIHLNPALLLQLEAGLDPWSYWQVRWRVRTTFGPSAVRIGDGPLPAEGRPVRVGDDYYARRGGDEFYYPYPMHPWVYALGWDRRVVRLRRTPRRTRLFFAGVVNAGYEERFDFPIMARPAVVECLLDSFRADACVVTSRGELAALRRTDRPIVLIVFRGDVTPMASNHFLPRAAYFRMLAGSDFALCPPGVFMPHSHNLVEAMAVGTIPVTNYPAFCRPELLDATTCLAFATPDDLVATVRRALDAPSDRVEAMRGAVARYYDDELSPEGTARRLAAWLDRAGPDARLVVNREFPAAKAWTAANARAR